MLIMALCGTCCFANSYTFVTPGKTNDMKGDPVSAEAVFTTSDAGTIGVVLTNLQANIKDVGELVTDLYFDISGLTPTSPTGTESGPARTLNTNAPGGYTDGSAVDPQWKIEAATGPMPNAGIHLDGLQKPKGGCDQGNACFGIIGAPDGTNAYSAANPSLFDPSHNPLLTSLTFTLTVSGVKNASVIQNVFFSFGTTSGDNHPGNLMPTPEPRFGAVLLMLVGGLVGYRFRRSKSIGAA
jgi:hypothetical protein